MRKTNVKFVLKSFSIYSSDKQPPPMAQLDHKSAGQANTSAKKNHMISFKSVYHKTSYIYFGEKVRIIVRTGSGVYSCVAESDGDINTI